MRRQGGRKVEPVAHAGDGVIYRPRLAATLREDPQAWGDEHGLFFYVPRLDFAHPHLTEGVRAETGGREGLPAIVVITTNAQTDAHWKQTYGSRATATRALVRALGTRHLASAYVQPKSKTLEQISQELRQESVAHSKNKTLRPLPAVAASRSSQETQLPLRVFQTR